MSNKIVFLGKAGVGKTSVIDVFFKNKSPEELIDNPPSPTRGFISSSHNWLDLTLGVFDTSGQELSEFLEDDNDALQTSIFESADIILYFLDYNQWINERDVVVLEILKINTLINEKFNNSKLMIIFHKVDLFSYQIKGIYELISKNLNECMQLSTELKVYFTSIKPDLIVNTYKTVSDILSTISDETSKIQEKLITILNKYQKTACFLTSSSNKAIVYSFTDDFNVNHLPHIYKNLEILTSTSKINLLNSSGVYITDNSLKMLNFYMDTIEESSETFQKIISFSETIKTDKLKEFCDSVKEKLKD